MKTISEVIDDISKASVEGASGTGSIANQIVKIRDEANEVMLEMQRVRQSADCLRDSVSKFRLD